GYATDQEYLLYTSTLRRYEPDLVVILLYSDDLAQVLQGPGSKPAVDFDEGLQVRPPTTLQRERLRTRELQYVDRSRRDHSAFLRLVSNALLAAGPVLRRASVSLGLAEKGRPPSEILPYGSSAEIRRMWSRERALLAALRSAVAADGRRLAVLYVPARWEIE